VGYSSSLLWVFTFANLPLIPYASPAAQGDTPRLTIPLHVSWGHRSPALSLFRIQFSGEAVTIKETRAAGLEPGEGLHDGAWQTTSGGGDVDGVDLTLECSQMEVNDRESLHQIWRDLIAQSDPDTARRLRLDPAHRHDPRKLTIRLDGEGTRGGSVTVDQLLRSKAFWVPSLDLYVTVGEDAVPFTKHQEELRRYEGLRVLDQVHRQPEATLEEYTARWEDMGSPTYSHPRQTPPGHIVCLSWDSAVPKFGIDHGGGAWSDLGTPDAFRLQHELVELTRDIKQTWKEQKLRDGLPILTTVLEGDGLRLEIEHLAYPLHRLPNERRGDIAIVLFERLTVHNKAAQERKLPLRLVYRRVLPGVEADGLEVVKTPGGVVIEQGAGRGSLIAVQGEVAEEAGLEVRTMKPTTSQGMPAPPRATEMDLTLPVEVAAGATRELIIKLPSPVVPPRDRDTLLVVDYTEARRRTIGFWSDWLARGARFEVPEKSVNDLFRANLWHALRLPRRHGGQGPDVRIDLPYSNFAYGQEGTPWPINQAVYVDDMIYDLRGYHDVALEELLKIYRTNLGPDGHIRGYANWGVYTPGMIYASARHFLLSQDRAGFDRLLPPTLKALDWCLAQIHKAAGRPDTAGGLVRAPLNDLTGEGLWAFNQTYVYAGLETLGRALSRYDHPRARECLDAASHFRRKVERAFAEAAVRAPLIQLRDHTWVPYVPCEALTPRRLMDQWYPTDVDTGAMHLLRLKAIPSEGLLADALLNDHEDNLYLKGWGMANEPVYNPQATAYLLRDDPPAVIRAFYSYMACAFSRGALEPVEHRWTWGQYFGPPSTDGAWFELYRNMLIREPDDESLILFQATPRRWLKDGKRIEVRGAPSFFGKLSMTVESRAASGEVRAEVDLSEASHVKKMLVRFRHPEGKAMRAVTVNGKAWDDFDPGKEWVRVASPESRRYAIAVRYGLTSL
jgi:hypothetical protein